MNSFSMVCRRFHIALGSLEAPGCSRIAPTGGGSCSSKAIFFWRYVRKVLFLKSFLPKVDSPVFSGRQKGDFLQHLTTAREDGESSVPVVFSCPSMKELSAYFTVSAWVIVATFSVGAFFAACFFCG
jgi:hypothetical protein